MHSIRKTPLLTAIALTLAVCLLLPLAALAAPAYPSAQGYLTDPSGAVFFKTVQRIDALGARLERETSAQAVVAVVDSLQDTPLEEYATGLFRHWQLGDAQKNNGVLLLIALGDRKARIEVGYGLEGALPDGKCGRILDEALLPCLREDDLESGIEATYDRLIEAIAQEYDVPLEYIYEDLFPEGSEPQGRTIDISDYWPLLVLLAVAALADILFNRGRILRAILWALLLSRGRGGGRGGHSGGGGGFRGGGGSSGGGGASRGW